MKKEKLLNLMLDNWRQEFDRGKLRCHDEQVYDEIRKIIKKSKREKKEEFIECGSCGYYHPSSFCGDCRDDNNRYTPDEIPEGAIIISLEEQVEE